MKPTITLLLMLWSCFSFAQNDAKVQKAIEVFNDGDQVKGIGMMEKIVKKDGIDSYWTTMIKMYEKRYKDSKNSLDKMLANLLMQSLGSKSQTIYMPNSQQCFSDLIYACRRSGVSSQSPYGAMLLRQYFIDYYPDTAISDTAKKLFNLAEKAFIDKDYKTCKNYYQQALIMQPDYYGATIYLGDSYWYLHNMDSAIFYFQKGIRMHTDLLEPRKYLVDALTYSERYEDAKKECIEAICLYPDENMFDKMSDIGKSTKINFNRHWMKRGCLPNRMQYASDKAKEKPWKIYQSALADVREYADSNGLLKANYITAAKYIEVYAWEKMLKSFKEIPPDFAFAKKMMDKGYLDCYIFISQFHYDIYDQYASFSQANKERIGTYLKAFCVD